jgi:hypothetical protein
MPKYTIDELKNLQNPYEALVRQDAALIENRNALDQLNDQEKINLVTALALACPNEQLRTFRLRLEELRHPEESENAFRQVLSRGLEVRSSIQAIAYPQKNEYPQNNLLGNQFNADLFNEFPELKITLVNQELSNIVSNLALFAKKEEKQELNRNIRAAFSETELGFALRNAFILKGLLVALTSPEPEKTFTNREFNPALFHAYPNLVKFYLADHEMEIAKKLAASCVKPNVSLNKISFNLERLKPSVIDHNNPLSKLCINFQSMVYEESLASSSQSNIVTYEVPKELSIPTKKTTKQEEGTASSSTNPTNPTNPKESQNRYGTFHADKKKKSAQAEHKDDSVHTTCCVIL